MIRVWRLVKTRLAGAAFDGEGARLNGGRWNSPGTLVAYASDSEALAMLEVLAHLRSTAVLASYSIASARFPASLVESVDVSALPTTWRRFPPPPELQIIGDRWVHERRSAVLRVPSAIIATAHNVLLSPAHPDFAKVVIDPPRPFDMDPRFFAT